MSGWAVLRWSCLRWCWCLRLRCWLCLSLSWFALFLALYSALWNFVVLLCGCLCFWLYLITGVWSCQHFFAINFVDIQTNWHKQRIYKGLQVFLVLKIGLVLGSAGKTWVVSTRSVYMSLGALYVHTCACMYTCVVFMGLWRTTRHIDRSLWC